MTRSKVFTPPRVVLAASIAFLGTIAILAGGSTKSRTSAPRRVAQIVEHKRVTAEAAKRVAVEAGLPTPPTVGKYEPRAAEVPSTPKAMLLEAVSKLSQERRYSCQVTLRLEKDGVVLTSISNASRVDSDSISLCSYQIESPTEGRQMVDIAYRGDDILVREGGSQEWEWTDSLSDEFGDFSASDVQNGVMGAIDGAGLLRDLGAGLFEARKDADGTALSTRFQVENGYLTRWINDSLLEGGVRMTTEARFSDFGRTMNHEVPAEVRELLGSAD